MLNVLVDATNLGLTFDSALTRTGIFRASDRFVREALGHPELVLRCAAMHSYAGDVQLARFDRATGGLLGDRRTSVWDNPTVALEDAMGLVDRLLAVGEDTPEGRRAAATLKLLSRTARPRRPDECYDVYHSLYWPLVPGDRVKARARAITVHDMIPNLFPELVTEAVIERQQAIVASIDAHRDWVICNSAHTRADFCQITSVDPARVFVTPFAAPPEVFHPEVDSARIAATLAKHHIPDPGYVLSVCTLEPRKNLARLVRAFLAMVEAERLPDLRLVLTGPEGWKAHELFDALGARPALGGRIILTGFVPDEDLSALYSAAGLFVYPSLYEGFGLPALEAMQCGVPVVTSRTSSLPEVVGADAITVDPTDEDALAEAMLRVLRDPGLARELRRGGLARSSTFSWSRTVTETVAAYRVMLADAAGGG
jgi:glycosyltransferase involved in cell wall biosynthesis